MAKKDLRVFLRVFPSFPLPTSADNHHSTRDWQSHITPRWEIMCYLVYSLIMPALHVVNDRCMFIINNIPPWIFILGFNILYNHLVIDASWFNISAAVIHGRADVSVAWWYHLLVLCIRRGGLKSPLIGTFSWSHHTSCHVAILIFIHTQIHTFYNISSLVFVMMLLLFSFFETILTSVLIRT